MLHLDDLHWADKPSLLLLQHLAQRTARDRLLILGAYRDVELDRTHPLSEVLGALRRLPNYRRVLLRGLPQESVIDCSRVIDPSEEGAAGAAGAGGGALPGDRGQPVLHPRGARPPDRDAARSSTRTAAGSGEVTSISDLGIPEGVREVIGRRLSRLSDGCNRMLTLATTMTGGFSWEALKAINGDVPEAELLDLLEEALAAQLIAERKGEAVDVRLHARADPPDAVRRAERAAPRAAAPADRRGARAAVRRNVDAHLPELAHHFYQAAPGGDVQKAVDYAKRAGDRAIELLAFEEAASQYELAHSGHRAAAARRTRNSSSSCCCRFRVPTSGPKCLSRPSRRRGRAVSIAERARHSGAALQVPRSSMPNA